MQNCGSLLIVVKIALPLPSSSSSNSSGSGNSLHLPTATRLSIPISLIDSADCSQNTYLDRDPDMPRRWNVQFCKSFDLYHRRSCTSSHPHRTPLVARRNHWSPHPGCPRDTRSGRRYSGASDTDPPRRSIRSSNGLRCSCLGDRMKKERKKEKMYLLY